MLWTPPIEQLLGEILDDLTGEVLFPIAGVGVQTSSPWTTPRLS
jgi:hypothetical protein